MKPLHIILAAAAATSIWALAGESAGKLPDGWILSGQAPSSYEGGVDYRQTVSGKGAKFLRHIDDKAPGWATLMTQISAEKYLNRRIRFRAKVKTHDIDNWAGLWMRVDAASRYGAAFYNTQEKPIKGNSDWQERSVVLDVPADAQVISFGVIGGDTGEVWIDGLSLDVVGKDVPVDKFPDQPYPDTPNL